MKKLVVLLLLSFTTGGALARPQEARHSSPSTAIANESPSDAERFKMALTDERRKLFAEAMTSLTAQQLETFWSVYSSYELEKNAITSARLDLAKEYIDTFLGAKGIDDVAIGKIVNEMGALQKKNIDLRLKYFGIYSQKLDAKAAGRFALVDDYITTAWRLDLLDHIPFPGERVDKK
jgi:hypothetical protein